MKWTEKAIVVSVSKFGENSLRVSLLAQTHGLFSGIVKFGNRKRSIFEVGNLLLASWSARLPEHMGSLKAELIKPYSATAMTCRNKLEALVFAATITQQFLPPRVPEPQVFSRFISLLDDFEKSEGWRKTQALFELEVLNATGYGLDLSQCAATGIQESLAYISPKTGRAVCLDAGEQYKDRMFKLPDFFKNESANVTEDECKDALATLRYFLNRAEDELHKKPLMDKLIPIL